jgi:hypothetical protein
MVNQETNFSSELGEPFSFNIELGEIEFVEEDGETVTYDPCPDCDDE